MNERSRLVELAHAVEDGMPVFPGLSAPRVGAHLDHEGSRDRYDGEAEFFFGEVEMPGNTGTYVDSPFHRYRDGDDLAGLPLERLADLPGVVVDCSAVVDRSLELVLPPDVSGHAVHVRTGWDGRWGADSYWHPGPFLSERSVDLLLRAGVALVAPVLRIKGGASFPVRAFALVP